MRRPIAALLVLCISAPAAACLWDFDTLQMERERFPGALELIVGKFLRHTDGFYEWRVKDRRADIASHDSGEKKLSDEELARSYDDLAVAYDKLKRHDEAIAAIREKLARLPQVGEYESRANLGTFLVHSGRLEEGVAELKKAIEINPEAHFGREKYQVLLAEYVLELRREGETVLPLDAGQRIEHSDDRSVTGFAFYVLNRAGLDNHASDEADAELARATKGVLGMMRFGDYRSPVLLEALGDLLLGPARSSEDARLLATRAYLRAAEETEDGATSPYKGLAKQALFTQTADVNMSEQMSLDAVAFHLRREVQEADTWFAKTIAHDEELWVEASTDPSPDQRFWEKYGGQEIRVGHDRLPAGRFATGGLSWPIRAALAGGAVLTAVAVAAALAWRRRRPTGYESDRNSV